MNKDPWYLVLRMDGGTQPCYGPYPTELLAVAHGERAGRFYGASMDGWATFQAAHPALLEDATSPLADLIRRERPQ